ncbi:glycosyltransferase family 2 protein [Candidatus Pacearchaeota archaeon]|nr:glycosyltransferase family 2 protein [Candidatus Pacearchaeota archaeon]
MVYASVVIPAYNEERYIKKALSSLKEQSYKDFEIIVVDDGSTDRTRDIVKAFKGVRLLQGTHKGPGASRNLGASNAKGEILVFVDADMTFDKDYLKELLNPLKKEKKLIGTSHGYEFATNLSNRWAALWGKVRSDPKDLHVIFRAIRKKIFQEKGGFDPKYGYADDQTLWLKYHLKPKAVPEAICYHRNPESLREVYRQSKWIGSSLRLISYPFSFLNYILPLFLVLALPFAVLFLSVRKSYKNRNLRSLIPWMIIFMAVRYWGTLSGIVQKVYQGKNTR